MSNDPVNPDGNPATNSHGSRRNSQDLGASGGLHDFNSNNSNLNNSGLTNSGQSGMILSEEELLEWVEGRLSPTAAASMAAVSGRRGLSARVSQMQANRRVMASLPMEIAPADLTERVIQALERETLLALSGDVPSEATSIPISTYQDSRSSRNGRRGGRRSSSQAGVSRSASWQAPLAIAAGLALLISGVSYFGYITLRDKNADARFGNTGVGPIAIGSTNEGSLNGDQSMPLADVSRRTSDAKNTGNLGIPPIPSPLNEGSRTGTTSSVGEAFANAMRDARSPGSSPNDGSNNEPNDTSGMLIDPATAGTALATAAAKAKFDRSPRVAGASRTNEGSDITPIAGNQETASKVAPITDSRALELARERRLALRARGATTKATSAITLAQLELNTGRVWSLSPGLDQAVKVELDAPRVEAHAQRVRAANEFALQSESARAVALASARTRLAMMSVGSVAPMAIQPPTPVLAPLFEPLIMPDFYGDLTPPPQSIGYLAELPEGAAALLSLKATLTTRLAASVEYVELAEPMAEDASASASRTLWWTEPTSAWTKRVSVPVVIEPAR